MSCPLAYRCPVTTPEPTSRHRQRRERLRAAHLYLCTDARRENDDLRAFADAALAGGVDIVQLRDKGSAGARTAGALEAQEELTHLSVLRDAARASGALLAVNDRADLAVLADADILHVGQGDLTPAQARGIVGPDMLLGRSTHDEAQARAAIGDPDVDYFCVGPCWTTPTKPGRPAVGLDLVRAVAAMRPPKVWFAIGGIDAHRLPEVVAAGASRIVVVRAITAAEDPSAAATHLRTALQ